MDKFSWLTSRKRQLNNYDLVKEKFETKLTSDIEKRLEDQFNLKALIAIKNRRTRIKNRQLEAILKNGYVPLVLPDLSIYLFIGPPKSGKTTAAVKIIQKFLKNSFDEMYIFACANRAHFLIFTQLIFPADTLGIF